MVGKFGSAVLRIIQLIFAAIVLALSIAAVQWQNFGSVPATNGYSAFTRAFGAIAALMDLAAIWISPLGGFLMAIVDFLATIFFFAGGIALAVGLHGTDCSNGSGPKTWHNKLISGGCVRLTEDPDHDWACGFRGESDTDFHNLEHRCRMASADTAFMFFGFVTSLIAAILCVVGAKSSKVRSEA